jgi:hypothetical protein
MGMDGDIFTDNPNHRRLIKYLIPVYVANMIDEDEIIEGSQNVKRLESDLEYLASI